MSSSIQSVAPWSWCILDNTVHLDIGLKNMSRVAFKTSVKFLSSTTMICLQSLTMHLWFVTIPVSVSLSAIDLFTVFSSCSVWRKTVKLPQQNRVTHCCTVLTFCSPHQRPHTDWQCMSHSRPGQTLLHHLLSLSLLSRPSRPVVSSPGSGSVSPVTPHEATVCSPNSSPRCEPHGAGGACAGPLLQGPDWVWTCGPSCACPRLYSGGLPLLISPRSGSPAAQPPEAQGWKWTSGARGEASQRTWETQAGDRDWPLRKEPGHGGALWEFRRFPP